LANAHSDHGGTATANARKDTNHHSGGIPGQPLTPEPHNAAVSPPAAELVTAKVSPAVLAALLARGDALIAIGDIAAARLVYQRGVALGSGPAATATGKTYDPRFLRRIGAVGVVADPDSAAVWYRKGLALGDGDAAPFLGGLTAKVSE
jgi:TPR repeat protein